MWRKSSCHYITLIEDKVRRASYSSFEVVVIISSSTVEPTRNVARKVDGRS
jgi:hypothetical protein